jgi:hypothetical protein
MHRENQDVAREPCGGIYGSLRSGSVGFDRSGKLVKDQLL